jgi:hypothetical protein
VATARDKLISEWHERLAAAEAVDPAIASRPAWLARLQIRLYRFLLSLYGESDWTTTPPGRTALREKADPDADSVVFDSPDTLPLAGKPAKSIGQIQSVLKSVAGAQSGASATGPLIHGLSPDSWVTLALVSAKNWHRIEGAAELLRENRIDTRIKRLGSRFTLEVQAANREAAARLLRAPPRRRPTVVRRPLGDSVRPSRPGPLADYFAHALVTGICVGTMFGALAAQLAEIEVRDVKHSSYWFDFKEVAVWSAFLGGWVFSVTAIVAIVQMMDMTIVSVRDTVEEIKTRRGSLTAFLGGLGWQCLAAGLLVGPFIGLLAVGIAGSHVSSSYQPALFFAGWLLSVLVAGIMYVGARTTWSSLE